MAQFPPADRMFAEPNTPDWIRVMSQCVIDGLNEKFGFKGVASWDQHKSEFQIRFKVSSNPGPGFTDVKMVGPTLIEAVGTYFDFCTQIIEDQIRRLDTFWGHLFHGARLIELITQQCKLQTWFMVTVLSSISTAEVATSTSELN